MTIPEVLTVAEAANMLQVHPETLRAMARLKRIPARKIGRKWRFSRAALLRWLDHGNTNSNDHGESLRGASAARAPAFNAATLPYIGNPASCGLESQRSKGTRRKRKPSQLVRMD